MLCNTSVTSDQTYSSAGSQTAGAILCMVAAIASNIGTNVQKASHVKDNLLPDSERTEYYLRYSWWLGFLLTMSASVGDFVALGLASQSLVAALGGATSLICNVVVATVYNKEKSYYTDLLGAGFIVAGAITFALTAMPKPANLDWELQFWNTWFGPYLCGQVVVTCVLLATISTSYFSQLRRAWYRSVTQPLEEVLLHLSESLTTNSL